jgi:hypothetical protein
MKRIVHLYDAYTNVLPDTEGVSITKVSDIVNHSVDTIFCDCLESVSEEGFSIVFEEILHKIRPQGYLVITFLDIKKICLAYLQNTIDNQAFLALVKTKNSFINIDKLSLLTNPNTFRITKIDTDNTLISIVIQRTGL